MFPRPVGFSGFVRLNIEHNPKNVFQILAVSDKVGPVNQTILRCFNGLRWAYPNNPLDMHWLDRQRSTVASRVLIAVDFELLAQTVGLYRG